MNNSTSSSGSDGDGGNDDGRHQDGSSSYDNQYLPEYEDDEDMCDGLLPDMNEHESYVLLKDLYDHDELFQTFSVDDLRYLAGYFIVLRFHQDDVIARKGEEATFMCLVLDGELEVHLENIIVVLKKGSLVGETNFFEGGNRSASVIAPSDAVVAVITYKDMHRLQTVNPSVMCNLVTLAALTTVRTLRRVTTRQQKRLSVINSPSSFVHEDDDDLVDEPKLVTRSNAEIECDDTSATVETQPPALKRRVSTVVKNTAKLRSMATKVTDSKMADFVETNKQELLFRSRLNGMKKNADEKVKREIKRRRKVQREMENNRYALMNRERQVETLENQLKDEKKVVSEMKVTQKKLKDEIDAHCSENESLKERIRHLEYEILEKKSEITQMQCVNESLKKSCSKVETERECIQEKHNKSLQTIEEFKEMLAKNQEERVQVENRVQKLIGEMSAHENDMNAVKPILDSFELSCAHLSSDGHKTIDSVQTDTIAGIQRTINSKTLQNVLRLYVDKCGLVCEKMEVIRKYEQELTSVRLKLHQANEKATELQNEIVCNNARMKELKQQIVDAREEALAPIHHYEFILKRLAVSSYVRTFRARKYLRAIYSQMYDLALVTLNNLNNNSYGVEHPELLLSVRKHLDIQRNRLQDVVKKKYGRSGKRSPLLLEMETLVVLLRELSGDMEVVSHEMQEQLSTAQRTANEMMERSITLKCQLIEQEKVKQDTIVKNAQLEDRYSEIEAQYQRLISIERRRASTQSTMSSRKSSFMSVPRTSISVNTSSKDMHLSLPLGVPLTPQNHGGVKKSPRNSSGRLSSINYTPEENGVTTMSLLLPKRKQPLVEELPKVDARVCNSSDDSFVSDPRWQLSKHYRGGGGLQHNESNRICRSARTWSDRKTEIAHIYENSVRPPTRHSASPRSRNYRRRRQLVSDRQKRRGS